MAASCLVTLPSFAQSDCDWNGTVLICHIDDYTWPDEYTWPDDDWGCQGIGCETEGDDDSNPPTSCPASLKLQLRQARAEIPNCIGDPGANFDEIAWIDNETSGFWYWFTNQFGRDWDDAVPSLVVLGDTLTQNNNNLIAAYNGFQSNLFQACFSNYSTGSDDYDECMLDAYYILDNYAPTTNLGATFVNWLLGTNFSVQNYDGNWGGRFSTDLDQFNQCHDVYQAWEDENCGGSL